MDSTYSNIGRVMGTNFCSAPYLRQTVLLSAHEAPEMRSIYNQSLKNLGGKVRTSRRWAPVQIPEGLDQVNSSPAVQTVIS